MPEGDTIHKVARYMHPLLQGRRLQRVEIARRPVRELCDRPIARVEAIGKHLLVHMTGWVLRVHLGLHGAWHRYGLPEAWQRPRWQAAVALFSDRDVFVCFDPEEVEMLRPIELSRSQLGHLGPDLLGSDCDLAQVCRRARALPPTTPLIDLLLSQHVACGLGNVYKNELLFMFRRHPLTPVAALDEATLEALYARGRALLQSNLGGWRRTTTYDRRGGDRGAQVPRLFVYGRSHCPSCAGSLQQAILGRHRRTTYWCPLCQPAPAP